MAISVQDAAEVKDRVVELTRSHKILWVLWNTENNKGYFPVIQSRYDFFQGIGSSLFQGFCVTTYQLFDKRSDVTSMPELIGRLKSSDPQIEQHLRSKIDFQKPLLGKFFSYRSNIFAHRNKARRPWEIFGKQSKTKVKGEMKLIVDLAQQITSALAETAGLDKTEFDEIFRVRGEFAAEEGTKDVFLALEKMDSMPTSPVARI
jgi:hypothetical protein